VQLARFAVAGPCGPGYRNYEGDVKPELYFLFDSYKKGTHVLTFGPDTFTIEYDPNAWTETQPAVMGRLKNG
jgi:hypothetical protein